MRHSASVISSAWFRVLLCGNGWNKSKALLRAAAHSQHIHSFAGLLKALSLRPTIQPTLSWASIKTSRQDTKEILEQTSCDSHLLYHAECSISCCWPFQLMPSIFCFEDDQDQVRHRTEYCSRVSLNPSMAYCLWWQGPLVHLRPCLDSASACSGALQRTVACGATTKTCCSSKLHLCRWISSCVFSFDRGGKEQRCS